LRARGARGPELARADEVARLLDARVEPRLEPALDALRAAVASGDDDLARAVLRRLWAQRPTGAAAERAAAFERILDGRGAIAGLELRAECVWTADPGIPGAGTCVVRLAVRSRDGVARALEPGPATLSLTAITVDTRGNSSHGSEARSFEALARLDVPAEGAVGIDLAQIPLELPAGALALRLTADVRLTPGTVRQTERALPAQRVPVEHGELVLLAGRLLAQGPAEPDELARGAAEPDSRAGELLEVALRVRREDRARVLDGLCAYAQDPARVERLASALRWLAPDVQGGADPSEWSRWLAARAERVRAGERRTEPVLPRALEPKLADR